MHIEKYNRTAVGHMLEHYERNPKIYKTQEHIHPELINNNFPLGNDEIKGYAKYKQILETPNLKIMNRADVNTMCDVILTLPKAEYFPQERYKEFFEVGYNFLLNKFCDSKEDFLVGCYCHADESKRKTDTSENSEIFAQGQLHIHFCFVPVIEEKGKLKVCAAKVVTKSMLKTLHREASDYFYEHFGFDVGIINGATKEGNLTVPQLKEQTKKYNELVETNKQLQTENEQLKMELAENMHNLKIWQEEIGITPDFDIMKQ
jgi:hypothetical protein